MMDFDSVTSTSVSRKSFVCENVSLDKALDLTDYGRFHYAIFASSALSLLSVGLQYGLSAYVLPAANCELRLQSSQMGFINAAFLVGGTSGSLLWGVIADLTGRRKVLVTTLLADVMVTICCSMMQDFYGLLVCRLLSGFFIGAPGSLTYTYLAEFHAPQHRSRSIYYSGVFNTMAWLLLPIVAWMVLPYERQMKIGNFVFFSSWRVFLDLLILPELIAGLWFLYLPETPKYLATCNPKEALNVLRQMFSVNTGTTVNEYPVKTLQLEVKRSCYAGVNAVRCTGKLARVTQEIGFQLKKLFKAPFWKLTLLLGVITFTNMFGYFGLGLWFPQILTRYQDFETSTNTTSDGDQTCQFRFNSKLFESTLAMGITCLATNLFSGWLTGKFKHNIIPLTLMITGAVSAASFYWTNLSIHNVIAACVFQSSMSTSNVALASVVVELFPTSVNAMAVCSSMFFGRIGAISSNITFGFLMDNYHKIAIALVSVILFIGASLCILIPNPEKPKIDASKNNIELSIISIPSL